MQYNELSSFERHQPGSKDGQRLQQTTSSLIILLVVFPLHGMLTAHTVEIQMPSCGSCASVTSRQSDLLCNLPNSKWQNNSNAYQMLSVLSCAKKSASRSTTSMLFTTFWTVTGHKHWVFSSLVLLGCIAVCTAIAAYSDQTFPLTICWSVCLSSELWKNGRSNPDAIWYGRSDWSMDEAGTEVRGSVNG